MIIILKKDGQVVTDEANPVDVKAMDNAAMILADPKDGDTIVYDADAGMWVAGTGGGSFDPDITNPQDGDTLVYDGTEQKWVNGSGGGSGGGVLVNFTYDEDSGNYIGDKSGGECYSAFTNCQQVIFKILNQYYNVIYAYLDGGVYSFMFYAPNDDQHHEGTAESENANVYVNFE